MVMLSVKSFHLLRTAPWVVYYYENLETHQEERKTTFWSIDNSLGDRMEAMKARIRNFRALELL